METLRGELPTCEISEAKFQGEIVEETRDV